MSDNIHKIIRYIIVMLVMFLVVCVIGIVRNWSVLMSVISSGFSLLFFFFINIVVIIYLVLLVFRR